jgi:hypothetical protein
MTKAGVVLALGGISAFCLLVMLLEVAARWRREAAFHGIAGQGSACARCALALPALLFWRPNTTPVRHFILPLVGPYLLLGLCCAR